MNTDFSEIRPAGYIYLLRRFGLTAMPNPHSSFVASAGGRKQIVKGDRVEEIYSSQYWPGDTIGDHLEFALKYDGVSLSSLKIIFEEVTEDEITQYIKSKPTGKYARRIWFFFEFLTGSKLLIEDVASGNYVEALEPELYYTLASGEKIRRYRVINNLLGSREYCPMVRKTQKLKDNHQFDVPGKCAKLIRSYSPELLGRALRYLYNKETKSSFEIENIKPKPSRVEKFMASLALARQRDFCDKESLIALQNQIVDPRFKNDDYRVVQNYVGQTISYQREMIHYVCPKPEDLSDLMQGLFNCHKRMMNSEVCTIVHATIIAYGFVFIHPFEDGNGRVHRFLIHNILSLRGLVPDKLMFPVSAVMLNHPKAYNDSLEAFSSPLHQLVEYLLDEQKQMSVLNDTAHWYQYMDMTTQAEALFDFIIQTASKELIAELGFLEGYDQTKKLIQDVIDMPNRQIDLFIRLCLQNNGRLSANKRKSHFDFLTSDELYSMETIVKQHHDQLSDQRHSV